MGGHDKLFERIEPGRQAFERESKFFTAFVFSVPAVMRDDRAIDLDTNGQIPRNRIGGEAVRIGSIPNCCPSDKHA